MIEWRTIFEIYEVSNTGLVRNKVTNKIHKQVTDRGYKRVSLYVLENGIKKLKTFSVHRLVAETFLDRIEGKDEIDHINACKSDNRVENLRWVNRKENMNNPLAIEVLQRHAQEISKTSEYRSKQIASHTYKMIPIRCIETGVIYQSMREASRDTGIRIGVLDYRLKHPKCNTKSLHFEYALDEK